MGSPSVRPRISEAAKQELCRRYGQGEPLAALCREFGCWTRDARFAVTKYGGSLREEDQPAPRACRVCGAAARGNTRRDLCAAHVRRFCSRCDLPLPAGRVDRWCSACSAAYKEGFYARGGPCSLCGERPRTARSTQCAPCSMAIYRAHRKVALKHPRSCRECKKALPPGRIVNRCTRCLARHERERRRARQAAGEHRCRMCGESLRLKDNSYCKGCTTMLANFRRAWHRGNDVARQLGTVRTQRRWQQESKAKEESCQAPDKQEESSGDMVKQQNNSTYLSA